MNEEQIKKDAKQFVDEIVKEKVLESTQEKQESVKVNALDEISMAVVFALFYISKSPVYPVLKKMSEYQNFNTFLGNALQSNIDEFIPEIGYKQDHRETMREEEKRNV